MALPDNDGDIPYGSFALTIGSDAFILETGGVQKAAKIIESDDHLGAPRGEVMIQGRQTGSGTLLFPDKDTHAPAQGATFTVDMDKDGTAETYKIAEVGVQVEAAGETKLPITFRKRINAPAS